MITTMQNTKTAEDFYWDGYEDATFARASYPPKGEFKKSYLSGYQAGSIERFAISRAKNKNTKKRESQKKKHQSFDEEWA